MSEHAKHRPAKHPRGRTKRYLRKKSVAARYDVDIRTVDRMARDGRIPAPKYSIAGSRYGPRTSSRRLSLPRPP